MNTRLRGLGRLAWAGGLALLALGVWSWWARARPATAREWLVVEPPGVSAGSLVVGAPRVVRLRVTNRFGGRPARLLGASDFCDADGCVTSRGLPRTIPPGGSEVVELECQGVRIGPFRRSIALYSDCPGQAEIPVTITGEVLGAGPGASPSEAHGP